MHTVPHLRDAAERQMRRLIEVAAVLEDPARRIEYDRRLAQASTIIPAGELQQSDRVINYAGLIAGLCFGALLMFCGSLFWAGSSSDGASSAAPTSQAPAGEPDRPPIQAKVRPITASSVSDLRRAAAPEAASKAGQGASPESTPNLESASVTPFGPPLEFRPLLPQDNPSLALPSGLPSAVYPSRLRSSDSPSPSLAGTWLQSPRDQEALSPGEYAAEFVELRLMQEGSSLSGVFRSRYRIPDRLMHPEVNFRFAGTIEQQEFSWKGEGGVKGRVRLSLESQNQLIVEWVSESSSLNSLLTEGSSKLLRRLD